MASCAHVKSITCASSYIDKESLILEPSLLRLSSFAQKCYHETFTQKSPHRKSHPQFHAKFSSSRSLKKKRREQLCSSIARKHVSDAVNQQNSEQLSKRPNWLTWKWTRDSECFRNTNRKACLLLRQSVACAEWKADGRANPSNINRRDDRDHHSWWESFFVLVLMHFKSFIMFAGVRGSFQSSQSVSETFQENPQLLEDRTEA